MSDEEIPEILDQTPAWGQVNDALNPDPPVEPTGQPMDSEEYKTFSQWGADNAEGDELGDLQGYANYVRSEHIRQDKYSDAVEAELQSAVYTQALGKNLINEEDGVQANAQQLFGAPEYSPEAQLQLLAKNSESYITAIAANNLDSLPEGTEPSEAYNAILTYEAKKNAYAKSVAQYPETAQNQEILDGLEYAKEQAYQYLDSGIFNNAAPQALLDGSIMAARIYDDEGNSSIKLGKAAEGKTVLEIIEASPEWGIIPQDAIQIKKQLETPEGFQYQRYDIARKQEINGSLVGVITTDKTAGKMYDKLRNQFIAYDKALSENDPTNIKRLDDLIKGQSISLFETATSLDPSLNDLNIDAEEFRVIIGETLQDDINVNNLFYLQDDPEKMGANVKNYGFGAGQVHSSLITNPKKFEESLAANKDISEDQKEYMRGQRESQSAALFDERNLQLIDGPDSEEWLGTLQVGLANGEQSHKILEKFLEDTDSYSEYTDRAMNIWESVHGGAAMLFTAPAAMLGSDIGRDHIIGIQAQNAERANRARLYGIQYGNVQAGSETLAPLLIDMAVTSSTAGAGGLLVTAKQVAKQGAKITAKGLVHGVARSLTMRKPFKEMGKKSSGDLVDSLVDQKFLTAPSATGRQGAMDAFAGFAENASKKYVTLPAMGAPAFIRSAGSTYASTYQILGSDDPNMSHEEKHDIALGSGLWGGFATVAIMGGFAAMGKTGLEDAFIRGMTKKESLQIVGRLTNLSKRVKLDSKDATKIWATAVTKTQKAMVQGAGKFKGQKNWATEALAGFRDEGIEEAFDEVANSYITDAYTGRDSGMGRWESAWNAFLIGGTMGAGAGAARRVGMMSGTRARAIQSQQNQEAEFKASLVSNLEETGAPVTAALVDQIVTGSIRSDKTAAAVEQVTVELDSNFSPTVLNPQPVAPERAEGTAPVAEEEAEGTAPVAEEEAEGTAPVTKAVAEGEVPAPTPDTQTAGPQLQQTAAAKAKAVAEAEAQQVKDPIIQNLKRDVVVVDAAERSAPQEVMLPDSDAAPLDPAQFESAEEIIGDLDPNQTELLNSLVSADEAGTVRELRVATAIQEGAISREVGSVWIDGDIPEANNPERTDVGNRKNLALFFEAGKVPTQQWSQENADAETLRKSEADYSFDEDNYVVGVRDPETSTWVGRPPISTEADTLNGELESSEGSSNDELDAYQAEQQELLDAPQKNAVNVAPILGSMPTETRNMVQEELGLATPEVEGAFGIPQGQLTNANVDQLVPTTNSQVVAAQEDGLDLVDIIEQQEINFAKEDRILTEENDAPQSTTPQSTKPQVTKLYAGEYKVESGGETFVVRRRITEDTMMPRGWLLFSTGNTLETTDNNNWGTEASTLKEAVSFIEEKQVQALRKPNQSLQAAVRKDVVDTPADNDAFVELVSSGFPQRISSTTPAGFKVSNKKEKGYYKQVADNAATKIYNTWPVTKNYKQPAGGSKFSGRKQSHYNPYNGETAEKTVKGFLDSSGNGVFNNDPVLANEFIEKGVPSFVDAATLEQINNKQFKLNPAIQVDYETGEVFNVISPSNLIAGQKQGSGAGAAQTVINTQPNRDTYVNVAQAADMFNRGLRETVMDINMIPLANGKSERAEVDRSEFTVGNYIDNVNQFISDGLSMLPDSDETSITLNRVFNQRGRLEPQYLEEAANAFRADAMLVANVFGVRQQILSSNIGQNLLQETLDKKTGNPTGQYELLVDNATNRAKLMKEFIRFTKISNEPTSTQLDSLMQVIAPMTAKGKTPTDVATKFILDTVINNPNFVDGQMPPMINLINKAADRYRKQQKSRSDGEATKAAEALYYEGKADQEQGGEVVTDAGSDIRWNKKVETADIGMPRPDAVGPDRATLYDTMDKAALNISSVLSDPANKDLREAFNDMALVAVGDSELGRKRVAEMDVESLANVVSEWAVAGNQRPRVRKFLKTLQEGKSPAATTLRKSFKLIGLSSRSVSGDPSQDVEYVEAVRESLEASMGTTYTARDARDYIRAIDGQVRNLWSRSRITKAQQKLARASNAAEIERLGLVSGNPESVINALQMITETGDPAHKLVAELLLENPALLRSVKFTIGEMDMAIAGRQSTMVDGSLEVFINLNGHNGRGLTNVLLEEYLHATLTRTLAMPTESMTPVQQQAVARLRSLMNDIREAAIAKGYQPNSAIMDSLANLDEFVAGILLSPDLQKEIKGLSPEGQSFFQRIAEAIMKFFRKGVTAKESSQYANAIADVIDLAQSTVGVSDPRMKVRAKRLVQRVTAEMKIAERRASDAGVLYTSIGEPRPEPAQLTPEEQAIEKAQQDLKNLGDNLTESDVGAEGNVYDAETEDAKRKARALLQVARELVPPEVPFRIDNTISAPAEFEEGVVTINPAFIMDLTSKLGLTNSKFVVAKVISHELSHVAAFNIIPQAEIDAMAAALTPQMYESVIDSYYADRPSEAAAAKAILRGTDLDAQGQADLLDLKARLTEEHLRMRMEKLTNGYTTEEDWAFYRTNPSLIKVLFRYTSAYFRRMAEMRRFNRELNNGSPNKVIDLALDNLILELRAIKSGYRIQETTAHFDPANPDGNFGILDDIIEEGMLDPERFADSSPALQSAIALPQDFVAEVSEEYDDLRVGTSKLGTRATPMETSRESNVSGDVVSDALLDKQLKKMNYAHFPSSIKRKRNPKAKREAIIDWVVGNLIHLHDSFPSDLRARATHWYDGARLIAERYADTYGYKPEQVAGVIAALSPQKDWFMNVAQAEQLLDIYTNHNDSPLAGTKVETMMQHIIDGATAPAKQKKGKTPEQKQKLDQAAKAKRAKIFANLKGKTIKELSSNQTHQGWAVRILAQTIHGQNYKALSPEGEFGHVMLKESDGLPASHTWGSIAEIEKGIRILNGEPITDNLGIKHKVRSFFNNIIAPNSPYGDVTMDTHAIAAAHLLPFGASAIEVKHNLGSDMNSSELNGVDGVYHIYADAYRKAAAIISQRGGADLQPRQLQSIAWEAIRLVHPSTTRRNNNYIAEQKKLWKNENHEQARDSITRGAKFTPAWAGFGSDTGAAEIPAGLQEGRGGDVTGGGVSVRGGGLQSAIGNPRLHGRRTNSGGTTLYRAGEQSSAPAQAQDRGLLELTAQDFSSIGQANKASHKFGTSVVVNAPDNYEGYELIMVEKNGATATASVSPTGEVGSVTKSPDATAEMVMEVFAAAVDTGKVKWLNGFDTVLPSIYADLGFEVVGRVPFDPTYKPVGWDFSTYKKFNNGQPDVVFMKYTGIPNDYVKGSGKDLKSYDAATEATLAEAERPAKVAQQRRNPNALGRSADILDFTEAREKLSQDKVFDSLDELMTFMESLEEDGYLGAEEFDSIAGVAMNSSPREAAVILDDLLKQKDKTVNFPNSSTQDSESRIILTPQQRRNPNGLQSAIAPSKPFSQDKLNYSGMIDQLELPIYSTGGYKAPTNKFKQAFLGLLDPRVKRIIERRDFFNKAAEQVAEGFKVNFDKEIKKAFGKDGPDADDAKTINDAIGRSAVLTKDQRDTIEDEYEEELKVIEEFDYETDADKDLDLKIAEDNKHSKIITLKTVAAKRILDDQVKALADLERISPELAQTITNLRKKLIEPIQEHIKKLYKLSDTMVAHFDVQQGIYLTTTYKMFTDSGYSQRVQEDPEYQNIKEAADKMFEKQEMQSRLEAAEAEAEANEEIFNKEEARIRIQADLDSADPDTLRTVGQQKTFEFLAKYERVGRNDIVTDADAVILEDNLKEKRDIEPELKALLGEVGAEGTIDNLVLTFLTVSKMASKQRMFQSLAAIGKSEGFMMNAKELKAAKEEDPDTYRTWEPVIQGDNVSAYHPLRNLYAPADIVAGLDSKFESRLNDTDTRPEAQALASISGSMRQLSGWAMATKTLGSVGFYIRNMLSNMVFFGPSQGFYNMGSMIVAMKYIGQEMVNPNRMDGYMSELTSLGIIKNEIRSTMLEDMVKGTVNFADVLEGQRGIIKAAHKAIGKPFASVYGLATRMAGAVDGFYKIAYYENELKTFRKAKAQAKEGESFFNKSDKDLKQMAADNVLMTAQSASQAPPIIKEFSSHGMAALAAPFVRFKAEVPRIGYNTFKLSAQERKSDSKVIRNRGRKRFFGITSTATASGFAPALLSMMTGTDDEDMDDFQRQSAPSYLRSHSFWSVGKGIIPEWMGGSKEFYQTIDLTYINPYAILIDPLLRAFAAGAKGDSGGVLRSLVGGLFGDQYLDTQIAAQALISVITNIDPTTGKPIVEEISDEGWDPIIKKATFLLVEAYGPDVVKRALKSIAVASSEDDYTDPDYTVKQILIGAVRPFKVHTIVPEKQLRSFLYTKRAEYSNVTQRKNEFISRQPMASGRVSEILSEEQENRAAIDNMTIRMMRGAKKFGMTDQQIYETLRATNHPKRKAQLLMYGVQDRIAITPDFGKRMIQYSNSEEETAMKLRRYQEAIQWVSEQPPQRILSEEPLVPRPK